MPGAYVQFEQAAQEVLEKHYTENEEMSPAELSQHGVQVQSTLQLIQHCPALSAWRSGTECSVIGTDSTALQWGSAFAGARSSGLSLVCACHGWSVIELMS